MKRALVIVLAMLGLMTGCDPGASEDPSTDGLLTRSAKSSKQELNALLRGTLELDPDRGCVLLSGEPVVWPTGTTISTDPPELYLPGGLTARPGDLITGGGGAASATAIRETASSFEGDVSAALDCASASTVLVFNARGEGVGVASPNRMRPCRSSQVRLRVFLQGTAKVFRGRVLAVNTIPFACSLRGRPRITLELAGDAVRSVQSPAPPRWSDEGGKLLRGWPLVGLAPEGKAQATLAMRNWCGPPDRRLAFHIELPRGGGEISLEARIRLGCERPERPVTLRVGPFEPTPE